MVTDTMLASFMQKNIKKVKCMNKRDKILSEPSHLPFSNFKPLLSLPGYWLVDEKPLQAILYSSTSQAVQISAG